MLDFIGTVVITAVMVVSVTAIIAMAEMPRAVRLVLAVAMGGWIGFAAASATSGLIAIAQPFPMIAVYVATPIVVAALALRNASARQPVLALSLPLLIGLNIDRVLGVLFLLLAGEGRLSGPFPYFAGIGDILTGLAALPLAFAAARGTASDRSIQAWNLFGALDLVVALALGAASAPASPIQIFGGTIGSSAILGLPWAFIPTVMVPFYLIVHGVILAQLRRRRAKEPASALSAAAAHAG